MKKDLPDAIWNIDQIPNWNGPSPTWNTFTFNQPDYSGLSIAQDIHGTFLGLANVKNWVANVLDNTADAVETHAPWLSGILGSIRILRDPLVLDLDGDGIELTSLSSSLAHFDLDGNGFAERTGWVSADDGLLAFDANSNGKIDDISELFGNAFTDGFSVLRQHDSNADNKINSNDPIFSQLLVWRDLNQDGVSDAGEISSLADLAITEISLSSTKTNILNAGNSVIGTSTFKMNGVNSQVTAVNFVTDVSSTKFIIPDTFVLDPEVFGLPNLKGYGNVPDLWIAMSLNPDLKAAVQSLVNSSSSIDSLVRASGQGSSYVTGDFDKMLSLWAGVSSNPSVSQLADVAAAFQGVSTPGIWRGAPQFLDAFETMSSGYAVRFFAQLPDLHIGQAFGLAVAKANGMTPTNGVDFSVAEIDLIWGDAISSFDTAIPLADRTAGLRYNLSSDSLTGNVDAFVSQLGADVTVNLATPWSGFNAWSTANGAIVKALGYSDVALAYQYATGYDALEILRAGGSTAQGSAYSDYLVSSSQSTGQRDLMIGGAGNDYLYGGQGSDTYLFERDFGNDVVSDALGARDEIVFKGFTLSEASFSNPSGNDLLITMATGESVLVSGYFSAATTYYAPAIEAISFDDRFALSVREIGDLVMATRMTSGSDSVTGFLTGSTFSSSAGDDTLIGLSGNDTFYYRLGSGSDIIKDGGGSDILILDETMPYRISYATDDTFTDLKINVDGVQSVLVKGGLSGAVIDRFIFEDGSQRTFESVWSSLVTTSASFVSSQVDQSLFGSLKGDVFSLSHGGSTVFGFDGNDTFNVSGSGSNSIYAGDGNDIINIYGYGSDLQSIYGGGGNENIHISGVKPVWADLGDGNDFIQAAQGDDTIFGGDGDDYVITGGGHDVIDGGNGIDEVEFYSNTKVTVDLILQTVDYNDGETRSLIGVENLRGSSGDDILLGDSGANRLTGWLGDDTLEGRGGDDWLAGDDGNDILRGGAGYDGLNGGTGIDILDGGADYDTAYFYGRVQSDMVISTNNGVVTITDVSIKPGNLGTDTLIGVESLYFDNGFVNIASPIILDMDGDGVHLVEKGSSSPAFDFDGDGILDVTGWFSSGDGMLVFDGNMNGLVDGVEEVSFSNVEGALSDLDGLRRQFDTNGDGILSDLDADFGKFGVWQDVNGNGIQDAGELQSLTSLSITSIGLGATAVNRDWMLGENIVIGTGTFERGGVSHAFQDVGFAYGSSLAASLPVPEDVGSGPAWQHISTQDFVL